MEDLRCDFRVKEVRRKYPLIHVCEPKDMNDIGKTNGVVCVDDGKFIHITMKKHYVLCKIWETMKIIPEIFVKKM